MTSFVRNAIIDSWLYKLQDEQVGCSWNTVVYLDDLLHEVQNILIIEKSNNPTMMI